MRNEKWGEREAGAEVRTKLLGRSAVDFRNGYEETAGPAKRIEQP
jgi:hypothetical protein